MYAGMRFTAGRTSRSCVRSAFLSPRTLLMALTLWSCRAEVEAPPMSRVAALTPASSLSEGPREIDPACEFVEREARKLGASMPRRLDEDTAATRVSARGCELTLEYQMLNLSVSEVVPSGVYAMQTQVIEQLCGDTAARATLERGGAFTNVYKDRAGAPIGQFTVRARDCVAARSSALEQSRL